MGTKFNWPEWDSSGLDANLKRLDSDSGRFYQASSGKKYPSVTTVLGLEDPQELKDWKNAVGESEANRIAKRATKKGSILHDLAEQYLRNNEIDVSSNPFISVDFNNLKNLLSKHVTDVYGCEVFMYSDYLKAAGATDLICAWDGKLSIGDFKTATTLRDLDSYIKYYAQVAAYSQMLEELTGLKVEQCVVIFIEGMEQVKPVLITDIEKYLTKFKEYRGKFFKVKGF